MNLWSDYPTAYDKYEYRKKQYQTEPAREVVVCLLDSYKLQRRLVTGQLFRHLLIQSGANAIRQLRSLQQLLQLHSGRTAGDDNMCVF